MKIKPKATLVNYCKLLVCNGYQAYLIDNTDTHGSFYAYVITPRKNVLYIQQNTYCVGYDISLEYMPSRKTGSGCHCASERAYYELTLENIKKWEQDGLDYARKLHAKMYESPDEWLQSYWDKDNLIPIRAEMSLGDFLHEFDFSYYKENNDEGERVFKLKDDQQVDLGGICQMEFTDIEDIVDSLDIYYHDYIYESISESTLASDPSDLYDGEEDYQEILEWLEKKEKKDYMLPLVRCIVDSSLIYENEEEEAR